MTNKKFTLIALFTILFCIGLIAGTAQPQRPDNGPGGGRGLERFARLLGLTDAQMTQIKTIRANAHTASEPIAEQIAPLHEQMEALIHASTFNEAAVRALDAKIATLTAELHVIQARTDNASYNLLTAEQKARLAELRQRMDERPNDGPGGGRRGGGGRP